MARTQEIELVYRSHKIVTNTYRDDVNFYVETGAMVDGDVSHNVERRFESMKDAKAAVDKYLIAVEKAKKIEQNILLEVLNMDGTDAVITGVHAGHGAVIGKNLAAFGNVVYPRADWIKSAIVELKQLQARRNLLDAQLHKVGIDRKIKRWGKVEPGEHSKLVERLLKEFAENKALADKGPPAVKVGE